MVVIPRFITRDFPFSLVQIWGRSYFRMFGMKTKTVPRNVFIVKKGITTDYRHPAINVEVNGILLNKLKGDRHFIQKGIVSYTRTFRRLRRFFGKRMSEKEFRKYLNLIVEAWPGFYLSIYVHEDLRFPKKDIERLKKFRLNTETFLHKVYDMVDDGLNTLYPALGVLARYLTYDEIQSGTAAKRQELKRRAQKKVILVDGFIVSVSKFALLKKRHDFSLEVRTARRTDTIKGWSVCRGVVLGSVRIAIRKQDFEQLKSGEVLVCPMTVPTFTSGIAKAAAIVTDEGGLTSHAAIISRELQKPCIIGTKIATKVLKDGDVVEVDAEKGTVRIIQRADEQ